MSGETRFDVRAVASGRLGEYLEEMGPSWVAGAIAAGPATMASLVTAGSFVREQAASGLGDPISAFVVAFAVVFALASLALGGRFLRELVGDRV
jgi:hypothetical protein